MIDLFTPCLLLDQAKLERNLRRMKAAAQERGLAFRPHLKTAKSRAVARLCADWFGECAMVSTLREIEELRGCGITDFLYSVAIVPGKLPRVARLLDADCKVTVAVDSPQMAQALAQFCAMENLHIPAVIELDLDGHRSGVRPADHVQLVAIGQILDGQGLLRGVMSHAGESYGLAETGALVDCAAEECAQTMLAAQTLRAAGLSTDLVSVGSTPTALAGARAPGVTELRAGVFMFFDLVQSGTSICQLSEIALSVLTSVISRNAAAGALIVDAGWMALSRDRGTAAQTTDYGYGQVCDVAGNVLPDIIVTDVQQEHGIIQPRPGSGAALPNLEPGDQLCILPNHACATAAQHDRYHLVDSDLSIVDEWPRFGGW